MSPNFASHALTPRLRCTIGARNQAKHAIPIIGIDHGRQEPARRLVRVGPEFSEYTVDPLRLQGCEFERECLAFGRGKVQPLRIYLKVSQTSTIRVKHPNRRGAHLSNNDYITRSLRDKWEPRIRFDPSSSQRASRPSYVPSTPIQSTTQLSPPA